MEGFPLLSLHSIILEKIIRKTHWQGYFRLQQTCRPVNEAIRKSRHRTSIYIEKQFNVRYYKRMSGYRIRHLNTANARDRRLIETSTIYGCRIAPEEDHQDLCNLLRENRITCDKLSIGEETWWTRREWRDILEILEPTVVNFYHDTAENHFDILLDYQLLKRLDLILDKDDVSAVNGALKFLSTCPKLTIQVQESPNPFFLIQYVLRKLSSQYCPTLDEFEFILTQHNFGDDDLLDDPYLQQEENDDPEIRLSAVMRLPEYFPQNASCKITVNMRDILTVHYTRSRSL